MTSKLSLVKSALDGRATRILNAREISDLTGVKLPTGRSSLSRLIKTEQISKTGRGQYVSNLPSAFIFRHYLADTKYKRGIAGIAYTIEDKDMEMVILETMAEKLPFEYLDTFGYSKEQIPNTGQDLEVVEFVGFDY